MNTSISRPVPAKFRASGSRWLCLAIALFLAQWSSVETARAEVFILGEEVGPDVVFTVSGSLDLPAPAGTDNFSIETVLFPSGGDFEAWQANGNTNRYTLTAEVPFGTGGNSYNLGVGSGDNIAIFDTRLFLSDTYSSGDRLNSTLTFAGTDLATLGVDTTREHVWTIAGTGDTITMYFSKASRRHTESDAGFTRSAAEQVINRGVFEITGSFLDPADCDVYCFAVDSEQDVDIEIITGFDTCLLLFDGEGRGLEGDDDDGSLTDARITRTLSRGLYYMAVSRHGGVGLQAYENAADLEAFSNPILDDDYGAVAVTAESFYGVANELSPVGPEDPYTIRFFAGVTSEGAAPNANGGLKKSIPSHRKRFRGSTSKKTLKEYFSMANGTEPGPIRNQIKLPPRSKFRGKVFSLTGGRSNVTARLRSGWSLLFDDGETRLFEVKLKQASPVGGKAKTRFTGSSRTTSKSTGIVRFEP